MSEIVNVDFVTKVVEVQVNDTETESLAALAAINSAKRAEEISGQFIDDANVIFDGIKAQYGYPFTASTVADMTDTTKIYVYTGSESGYTAGNWYYYNGSAWVSGGVFISVEGSTKAEMSLFGIDDLLWDNTSPASKTQAGITWTVDKINKTVAISGTATASSVLNFYYSENELPTWLQKGKRYYAYLGTDTDIEMRVVTGTSTFLVRTNSYSAFVIPNDATNLIIRLQLGSGKTVNTVVRPIISETLPINTGLAEIDAKVLNYQSFNDLPSSFGVADILVNHYTYGHLADKTFADKPDEISSTACVYIKREKLNNGGGVSLITIYDVLNEITYYATYRSVEPITLYPWKKVSNGENTLTYYDINDLPSNFGVGDIPIDTYIYGALSAEKVFSDAPSGLPSNAQVYIKKQRMVKGVGVSLITVYDVLNEVTYYATYRSVEPERLWDWKTIVTTDALSMRTNTRTCNIFKRVLCVGDSYTEGYIWTGIQNGPYKQYSWPAYMEHITGNEWVNCGVSGSTTKSWLGLDPDAGIRAGLPEAQAAGVVQAYIVQLLINDASHSTRKIPVGTVADIGDANPTTYYGCYSKIIRELNAISPNALIFVCTCPYTVNDYADYQQAIRDIAEAYADTYHVHLLDMKADEGLFKNPSLVGDKINNHYTALGYEQFAEIYANYISNYINNHISAFQNVHAIPYDS